MTPRVALVAGAMFGFGFGLPLLLLPAVPLTMSGMTPAAESIAISRGAGATLVGVGVIDWMARDAVGTPLRGLIVGNFVLQALQLVANGVGIVAGQLPPAAAIALPLHLVLAAVFAGALRSLRPIAHA